VTAPEPLKLTWEEARALLWERERARLRFQVEYRHGGTVTADSWERVAEPVLGTVVARDEAAELRAAMAEMSDLVYIIRHAEEELGNAPLLRDMGVSTAHMREAIESAWERLCALAALHDDTSALAATEGSE